MKSCCGDVLFFDRGQNWSIFLGKDRSKPEIIVFLSAILRLRSLALMLFSLYTPKTISTQLHGLKRKLNVLQGVVKNRSLLLGFSFLLVFF